MGVCLSVSESDISDHDSDMKENNWGSYNDDMKTKDGSTVSTTDVRREGEDDVTSQEIDTHSVSKKAVAFKTESHEKNVLREIFSEESLLEKSRKSFNADMRMFAIMLEDLDNTDKDRRNPK